MDLNNAACIQSNFSVAPTGHAGRLMRGEHDRSTGGRKLGAQPIHEVVASRVERGVGFIEKHNGRRLQQESSKREAFAHPRRVDPHRIVSAIGQAHAVQHALDIPGPTAEVHGEIEVVPTAQLVVVPIGMREQPDRFAGLRRRLSEHAHGARSG